MSKGLPQSSGCLVAAALAGSWRSDPPTLELEHAELDRIVPMLLRSGAAALCWGRVRQSPLLDSLAARDLQQAYRLYTLQNALKQQTIKQAISLLRSVGVEPILVKGWAVARHYPEQGLRPYGDIDLGVRRAQFGAAETVLEGLPDVRCEVDLHDGFAKFGGGSVDAMYGYSQSVKLGTTDVRVLCAEDHLRILSIHMLREGAWRPLWLCDIAATVESRGSDFDWDRCLTENRRLADWVICAIRLSQRLLGADISGTPASRVTRPLPRWLIPSILKEWESEVSSMSQRHGAPMAGYLRSPNGVLKGFRNRWPNTIEATVSMRAPFNELPRLPFQVGTCVARTAKFAARLPKLLREQ